MNAAYLENNIHETIIDTLGIPGDEDYCSAHYYYSAHSSYAPTLFQLWTEFFDRMDITTVDVLRCSLSLSVSLFLCTAVLLQGTLLELGIVHCRRTLGRWNALLTNSCRRLSR